MWRSPANSRWIDTADVGARVEAYGNSNSVHTEMRSRGGEENLTASGGRLASAVPTAVFGVCPVTTIANSPHTEPRNHGSTATVMGTAARERSSHSRFQRLRGADDCRSTETLRDSAAPCKSSSQFAMHRTLSTSAASHLRVNRVAVCARRRGSRHERTVRDSAAPCDGSCSCC